MQILSNIETESNVPELNYIYIDTDTSMEALKEHIKDSGSIAIDTEADSLYHYYHKVCLIQITLGGQNYIVDPLSDMDLSGFLKLLEKKPLILHDAGYDLRMMQSSFNFSAKGKVFDTMAAAQLLGHEKFGLGSLVKKYFGIEMPKGGQKSNWSKRPLSKKQLEYASEDTFYLHKLADIFSEELEKLGRMEWHDEWSLRTVKAVEKHKETVEEEDENAWRIKGARHLHRNALTHLKQIWKWRERESQKQDVPPFKVMQNSRMLKLAVWASTSPHESIKSGPKLPSNCKGRRLQELKKALAIAYNTPKAEKPRHPKVKHRPKPPSESFLVFEELKIECDKLAADLGVASNVIAPRGKLKSISIQRPKNITEIMKYGDLMKWQAKLLEPAVRHLLSKYPEAEAT